MTKGPDSKITKTVGVRLPIEDRTYIYLKAAREGRSAADIIRDYVTWGIEAEKDKGSDNPQ